MKKWMIGSMLLLLCPCMWAQQYVGGEALTFFQTPVQATQFDYADVYMMQDKEYAVEQGTYNSNDWKRTEFVMNKLVDSEGRFSVWKFIPSYIQNDADAPRRLVVEIWFSNLPAPASNGDEQYYKVRYRYKLSYSDGTVLMASDNAEIVGVLDADEVDETSEFLIADRMGIQAVFNRVRQKVYAQYGFCSFDMPFTLVDFSSIVGLDILQQQMLDAMNAKEGLLPNKQCRSLLMAYSEVLELHIARMSEEDQSKAHRNLAICRAWLGDTLAVEHLQKYAAQLKTVADSADYFSIDLFVRHYPKALSQHGKLLRLMSSNLSWLVDAFTYNDLLSNIYELEYNIPFLPVQPLKGNVSKVVGTLTQENKEPLTFTLKFNKKGQPKTLDMNRVEYNGSQKNNVRINTLHISYRKNTYDKITCSSSQLIRTFMLGLTELNKPVDKMEQIMFCKTDNVLGGFVKFKIATESSNQFVLNADGSLHIKGEKALSRPHAALKRIADASGENYPTLVSANSTTYDMLVDFDDNGLLKTYEWEGSVMMEKNVGSDNYAYIKADSVDLSINTLVPYGVATDGTLQYGVSLIFENKLADNKYMPADAGKDKKAIRDGMSYQLQNTWTMQVKVDDMGNWTYLKVGPYEVKRTITYQ